jgi:Lumazine binding domain
MARSTSQSGDASSKLPLKTEFNLFRKACFLTSIVPPSAEDRHRPLIWLLILRIPGPTQLTAGYRVDRFLDLGDGIVSDLVQLYMRHVRHLVGWHNAVDDRRAIDAERFVQFGSQQAGDDFSVLIIPHTLAVTTFGALSAGDAVNLEVDLMARYVARLTGI